MNLKVLIFQARLQPNVRLCMFHIKLAASMLRSSKRCLRLCNDIERKHIFVDVIRGVKPVSRSVLGCDITNALGHRRVDVGKNLQRRTPVPPDLLEELQPVLNGLCVLDLIKQDTHSSAILDGLPASLALDCGRFSAAALDATSHGKGTSLTGEHGMGGVANQDESVLVPLGDWSSGNELPELHVSRLSAPCVSIRCVSQSWSHSLDRIV